MLRLKDKDLCFKADSRILEHQKFALQGLIRHGQLLGLKQMPSAQPAVADRWALREEQARPSKLLSAFPLRAPVLRLANFEAG